MKKLKSKGLLLIFFISISVSYGQSMESFFKKKGIELVAFLAHPTNTYDFGTVKVYRNSVRIKIYYEGYTTEVSVKRNKDVFYEVEVLKDTDWVAPFGTLSLIKGKIVEVMKENPEFYENKTKFERYIQRKFEQMSGTQLTAMFLTLLWLEY